MISDSYAAATLPIHSQRAMPTLKQLAGHPSTNHTLHNLVYILTEALQVTSAYILDWDPEQGTSTVLAEYITPQADQKERVSDLHHTYNMYDIGEDGAVWLNEAQVIVEHLDDAIPRLNSRFHLQQYRGRSVLGIPLTINQQVVGYV